MECWIPIKENPSSVQDSEAIGCFRKENYTQLCCPRRVLSHAAGSRDLDMELHGCSCCSLLISRGSDPGCLLCPMLSLHLPCDNAATCIT